MSLPELVQSSERPHCVKPRHATPPSEDPTEIQLRSQEHQLVVEAASRLLASRPFAEVTLQLVAEVAGLRHDDVESAFASMREIGIAILEAEGTSMRLAQKAAYQQTTHPVEVLRLTFQYVGENMASKPVVRAGMRIASESRGHFPERAIDPFRTWRNFIHSQLSLAETMGLLKPHINIEAITWLLVSAGLGSKELVSFRDAWDEIGHRLESVLDAVLHLILLEQPSS